MRRGRTRRKRAVDLLASLESQLGRYVGKWIVVVDGEVVAVADTAEEAYTQARQAYPDQELFIMKVPSKAVMLL